MSKKSQPKKTGPGHSMKIVVLPERALLLTQDMGSGEVMEGPNRGEKIQILQTVTEAKPLVRYRGRFAYFADSMSVYVENCCRAIDAALAEETAALVDGEVKVCPRCGKDLAPGEVVHTCARSIPEGADNGDV